MSGGKKKNFPIIVNFSLKFFILMKYLGSLIVASYFIKENATTKEWLTNIQIIALTTLVVYFFSGLSKILIEQRFQKLSLEKSSSTAVLKF